jgi:hypothetical protein
MRCWRMNMWRNFSLYLTGELAPQKIERIEDHLLDCGSCRARLARIRTGHRFAQAAPRFKPQRDPWAAIEAAIDKDSQTGALAGGALPAHGGILAEGGLLASLIRPSFVIIMTAVVILILGLLAVSNRRASIEKQGLAPSPSEALNLREFHAVSIADMERTTKPHVVAEGFVSEVRIDDEDGDLRFKLVESLRQAEPFIICEIIDPIKIEAPIIGSRVRVYGVSRYDSQENHNWYEVHPVLNIEVIRD